MTEPNMGEESAMNGPQAHTAHTDSQGTAMARLESHAKWIEAGSIWECGEARIDGPGFARDMRAVIAELEKARADLAALTAGPQFFAVAGLVESDLKERYESLRETMDRIEAGLIDAAKIKAIVRAWLDADSSKWGEFERTLDAVIESEGAPGPNKMEAAIQSGAVSGVAGADAKEYPDFDYSQLAPTSEWGDPIPVDGKRPEWLRDDDWVRMGDTNLTARSWSFDGSHPHFRLLASHPYYLATSRGFTYWPGGDEAPADWDGGEVFFVNREAQSYPYLAPSDWAADRPGIARIIGYHRKPEATRTFGVGEFDRLIVNGTIATPKISASTLTVHAPGLGWPGSKDIVGDCTIEGGGTSAVPLPEATVSGDSFTVGTAPLRVFVPDPGADAVVPLDRAERGRANLRNLVSRLTNNLDAHRRALAAMTVERDEALQKVAALSQPRVIHVAGMVEADLAERYESLRGTVADMRPRVYNEEERRATAVRITGFDVSTFPNAEACVDAVAQALGMRRAGA